VEQTEDTTNPVSELENISYMHVKLFRPEFSASPSLVWLLGDHNLFYSA